MPITQSRMVALVRAATDYQQAFIELKYLISRHHQALKDGRSTPAQVISDLFLLAGGPNDLTLLKHPIESATAIAIESAHFTRSTQSRNDRVAANRRAQRAANGTPTRIQSRGQFTPYSPMPPGPSAGPPSDYDDPEFDLEPPPPPDPADFPTLSSYITAIKAHAKMPTEASWEEFAKVKLTEWTKEFNSQQIEFPSRSEDEGEAP